MEKNEFEKYRKEINSVFKDNMTDYFNQWYAYQVLLNAENDGGYLIPEYKEWFLKRSRYLHEMADYMRPDDDSGKFNELYWDIMRMEAKNHQVDSGLLFLEKNRIPNERFYEPRRDVFLKHNITQSLQDIIDDKIDILVVAIPPGTGKLLADDTPVLTACGWKRHGDLTVGDRVYDESGQLRKVLHVFPKDEADCLVTFTNGDKIQCHENHEWVVYDVILGRERIVETKELLDLPVRFYHNSEGDYVYLYKIINRDEIAHKFNPLENVYIKSVKKVRSKKGNCIQVEGGIYCAGKTMIPTHNSTIEVFLLSLVGGWFPNNFNLSSAHSSILTRSLYDGVMEIINDPVEYAWHDLFPNIRIQATNAKETTINLERRGRFKTWTFRSIDGSLTGATRCDKILTADDLVSGIEEALNKTRLDTLWTKVVNDLFSRMLDGCKRILFNTRWSVHDPAGRLEVMLAGNPRARFISVPALDENGESNFEFKVNGFSKEYFLQQKEFMDEISFNCLYQQKAVEREGLLFPSDKLRRFFFNEEQVPEREENYIIIPDREPDAIWAVCDTKDKGTDFESLPVAYQYGEDFYIVDVVFDDTTDYEILDRKTADILIRYNPHKIRFESNNAGNRVAYNVQKLIDDICRAPIEPKNTQANKETKILVNSDWILKHCIFLHSCLYSTKDDYGRFIANVVGYTTKAKVPHDDGPDSLAMLSEYVIKPVRKPTRFIKSPV